MFEIVISNSNNNTSNNKNFYPGKQKVVQDRQSHYSLLHGLVQSNSYMVIMIETPNKDITKIIICVGTIKGWGSYVCYIGVREERKPSP